MKNILSQCVNKVVNMIEKQIEHIESIEERQVKVSTTAISAIITGFLTKQHVFLVGGFGRNPFLKESLAKSLSIKYATLKELDEDVSYVDLVSISNALVDLFGSLTAVVRGALIYGIERKAHKGVKLISKSTRSYGIVIPEPFCIYKHDERDRTRDVTSSREVAAEQFAWLIRRGDAVLSDDSQYAEKEIVKYFGYHESPRFSLAIYMHSDEAEDLPQRWKFGKRGE